MIFNLANNFYKNLDALFINLKLRDKKVVQLYINSATFVKLFDNIINFEKYTHKPDTSSKKIIWKVLNSLKAGIRTKKKAGMMPEKRFARFEDNIVGRG